MTMLRNPLSSGVVFLLENIQVLKVDVKAQVIPVSTAVHFSPAEGEKQYVSDLHETQWAFRRFATICLHLICKIQAIAWVN